MAKIQSPYREEHKEKCKDLKAYLGDLCVSFRCIIRMNLCTTDHPVGEEAIYLNSVVMPPLGLRDPFLR